MSFSAARADRTATRLAEQEAVVLAMLEKAARMNDECPSNAVLAVACGFSAANQAPAVVARLEKRGVIRVQRNSRKRKVTIVATGDATCEVIADERTYGSRRKRPVAAPPRNQFLALRPALTPKDRLAEQVAEMGDVNVAASGLRMSPARRDALWAEIVADLGPQAA